MIISKQKFHYFLVGTLLYTVVLGFFSDYTDILYTQSYSTTFLAAIVMQILTMLTFRFKDWIASFFPSTKKTGSLKALYVFCIWLIIFFSKFLYLYILDILFGPRIEITGFFGILGIIIIATLLFKATEIIYQKLDSTEGTLDT
jgi:hypothetical protein